MDYNIIQLRNQIAITVDDSEFRKIMRKYKGFFSFRKYITINDSRGHKFTLLKDDILLLEDRNGK